MVCGGGGEAAVLAGEGVVEGLCAYMQDTHAGFRRCAMLASWARGVRSFPFSLPKKASV